MGSTSSSTVRVSATQENLTTSSSGGAMSAATQTQLVQRPQKRTNETCCGCCTLSGAFFGMAIGMLTGVNLGRTAVTNSKHPLTDWRTRGFVRGYFILNYGLVSALRLGACTFLFYKFANSRQERKWTHVVFPAVLLGNLISTTAYAASPPIMSLIDKHVYGKGIPTFTSFISGIPGRPFSVWQVVGRLPAVQNFVIGCHVSFFQLALLTWVAYCGRPEGRPATPPTASSSPTERLMYQLHKLGKHVHEACISPNFDRPLEAAIGELSKRLGLLTGGGSGRRA